MIRESSADASRLLPNWRAGTTSSVLASSVSLTAVESMRSVRTRRVVFTQAKIVHVMDGAAGLETAMGTQRLGPGMSFAVGAGRWCRIHPEPIVRVWTVYADEAFLRTLMTWFLPDRSRVLAGVHPDEWEGGPLILSPGIATLQQIEPLWRQLSVLRDGAHPPEVIATRTVELFSRWVHIVAPSFLNLEAELTTDEPWTPIDGCLADAGTISPVDRAVRLLRSRLREAWTVTKLSEAVALSRSHLTRLFVKHTGIAPMRFLAESRLTEFTRLVEETDLSIASAARFVGWNDPRVASSWFYKRHGITPSQFRRRPHPHEVDDTGKKKLDESLVPQD